MQVLSYGYKLPESGDKGAVFYPAQEFNISRLNSHTHDGNNSPALTSSSIANVTQAIAAGSWVAQGGGMYKQTITMPGALAYDGKNITFKNTADGSIMYLDAEKVTNNSYDVYINDNSISLTALYN